MPLIAKNLLSVSYFARDSKVYFEFHPSYCCVEDQETWVILLKGTLGKGIYKFDLDITKVSLDTKLNFNSNIVYTTGATSFIASTSTIPLSL